MTAPENRFIQIANGACFSSQKLVYWFQSIKREAQIMIEKMKKVFCIVGAVVALAGIVFAAIKLIPKLKK